MPSAIQYFLRRGAGAGRPAPLSPVERLREKVVSLQRAGVPFWLPALGGGGRDDTPWLPKRDHDSCMLALRHHPIVKPALLGKLFAVSSLDPSSTPAAETPRDEEVAEFVRYQVETVLTVPDLVLETAYPALVLGRCVCEKVWDKDLWPRGRWAGKRFYRAVKAKPGCEVVYDQFREPVAVRGPGEDGKIQEWEDLDRFLIIRNLPFMGDDGTSDLYPVERLVARYENLQTLRDIHLEKFTSPVVKGTYQRGNEFQDEYGDKVTITEAMAPRLAGLKARGWILVPEGVDIEGMELATRGEAEFQAVLDSIEQKIALAVAGAFLQMLVSPGGSGSPRGNSKVQQSTAELFVWHLVSAVCSAWNRQLVPPLVRENYAGADYPTLSLGGVNPAEQGAIADLYLKAVQAGARPSRKAFGKATGVQMASDPADELTGPPAPPQPAGGAPAPFSEPATEGQPAQGKDVALGGSDGAKAEQLLAAAKAEGIRTLSLLTARALNRLFLEGGADAVLAAETLFSEQERAALAAELVKIRGTAELLGRSRVRLRARQAETFYEGRQFGEAGCWFSAEPTAFAEFAEPVVPMTPAAALEYFLNLVPDISVSDPRRFGDRLEREAFTLAEATDATMLDKVKQALARRLETGRVSGAAVEIDAILDDAGVTPKSPQYSEMIVRTNLLDSYNIGAQRELDEVSDIFPWWQYLNPSDSRSRPAHAEKNGRYYLSSVPFTAVRGASIGDLANCRCTFAPVDKFEVEALKAQGITASRA